MNFKGYVTSREFGGMKIPVPAQNSCLREYVTQRGGSYILPHLESCFENCFHQLFGLMDELEQGDTILMYSVSMLPKGQKLNQFLRKCKKNKLKLAFVLENLGVDDDHTVLHQELSGYLLADLEMTLDRWKAMPKHLTFS